MNVRKLWLMILSIVCCLAMTVHAGIFTVPDRIIDSCVFIMKGDKAEGTGFLVWIKDQDAMFCYLISAKHVIKPILSNPQTPLSVRFNLKGKKSAEVVTFPTYKFEGKRWVEHTNPVVDLAVIPLAIFDRISEFQLGGFRVDSPTDPLWATPEWLDKYKVGPGDQVFTVGLVPYLYSEDQKNLVLSRFGTVSLLPRDEIILLEKKQRAYFIDCQAFGGNSGGPAFVLIERSESGGLTAGWRIALLGVVTEFIPSPLRGKKVNLEDTTEKKQFQLIENTGLTKVVPVDYLLKVLFSDKQKQFRKEVVAKEKEKAELETSK